MSSTQADWCQIGEDFAICGTDMKEHSREDFGIKWCFQCRGRHKFWKVLLVPNGLSYYGPSIEIECDHCKGQSSDLFPGWSRTWGDEDN